MNPPKEDEGLEEEGLDELEDDGFEEETKELLDDIGTYFPDRF